MSASPLQKIKIARLPLLVVGISTVVIFGAPVIIAAANDYPFRADAWCMRWLGNNCQAQPNDGWNFYKRECTSFVAWRLRNNNGLTNFTNQFLSGKGVPRLGNAFQWKPNIERYYKVDHTPAPGAVAWWGQHPELYMYYGHVAWVEAVENGTATIEEYNYGNPSHNYNNNGKQRKLTPDLIRRQDIWFIHFKDLGPGQGAGAGGAAGNVPAVKGASKQSGAAVMNSSGGTVEQPDLGDYDNDGKADIGTYRPSAGTWWLDTSTAPNLMGHQWGWGGDIPVPADYNGDGGIDIATWRPSTGGWWIDMSGATPNVDGYAWGWSEDIPVPADYDGDGKADMATWRPSTGVWNIHFSSGRPNVDNYQWGWSEDIPVPADYDGDGKADMATWRPSTGVWNIHFSSGRPNVDNYQWGWSEDIPVPGDYDNDKKADIATFRPSTGTWELDTSTAPNLNGFQWGWSEDIPVPADYNGDGGVDPATWRPSTAGWWIEMSGSTPNVNGYGWGWGGDIPAVSTLNRKLLQRLGLRP